MRRAKTRWIMYQKYCSVDHHAPLLTSCLAHRRQQSLSEGAAKATRRVLLLSNRSAVLVSSIWIEKILIKLLAKTRNKGFRHLSSQSWLGETHCKPRKYKLSKQNALHSVQRIFTDLVVGVFLVSRLLLLLLSAPVCLKERACPLFQHSQHSYRYH